MYIRRDGGVQGPLRPLAIKDVVEQKYQKVAILHMTFFVAMKAFVGVKLNGALRCMSIRVAVTWGSFVRVLSITVAIMNVFSCTTGIIGVEPFSITFSMISFLSRKERMESRRHEVKSWNRK